MSEVKKNFILSLSVPIIANGVETQEIEMRRPTLGDQLDMMKMKGDDQEKEIKMTAQLCELALEDMRKIDLHDYMLLQEAYLDFLPLMRAKLGIL